MDTEGTEWGRAGQKVHSMEGPLREPGRATVRVELTGFFSAGDLDADFFGRMLE